MKTNLSIYNNAWYSTGAGRIKRLFWYFTNILFFINPLNISSGLKVLLLKFFGAKIAEGVVIKPGVNIKYPWRLEIGPHSWIGEKVWIDNLVAVKVGANCCLSQGAMLLTGSHDYKKATFDLMVGEIVLEDGAWVGAQAVVCPKVRVGSHAVVAVGSVATGDVPEYEIWQGNPAVFKRERIVFEPTD
ncbi:WcaF family extracellular polysaccharide biosynthesis acetyltransferase [Persicobacter psychrovividus]|uniref:Colanic acid biosynthesis acetyltransferase WcaF n=1 Tax=Persicobacter psychrovividus TaxID=387638 RepID=A0ABM7VD71_9BACT|nr:colanic acid biosynthesis acetyltransferase WcaF [Persicobacter psychrovividus]